MTDETLPGPCYDDRPAGSDSPTAFEKNIDEIVALTQSMIRFRSTATRPDQIRACADFIESYLQQNGIAYRRENHAGIPNILVMPEAGHAPVLFMAHMDVVDGPDALFQPVVRNGRLYGRGSIDDKYAVALTLVLAKNWMGRLPGRGPAGMPFGILITGDEESGGANGAARMLGNIHADFAIALDGGSPAKIVVKEKGILRLRLVCHGKTAHGSRPWLGINAIDRLIGDYLAIHPLFSTPPDDNGEHWHRTLNFGMLHAGQAANQVPDRAEAVFDIRYTEDDDIDVLLEQLRSTVNGEVTVEAREPLFMSAPSRYLDALLALAGPETRTGCEHGASDARYLAAHGIPAVVWGAAGEMSQHAADEHLCIDSAGTLYRILDAFLAQVAAPDFGK